MWVFFVREYLFSLGLLLLLRVVALFLGMRKCVTPLYYSIFNQESVVLVRRAFSVGLRRETNEN